MDAGTQGCPVCGSARVRDVGPVFHPEPALVAGVAIDLRGMEFRLLECESCRFRFKRPAIPDQMLLDCYAKADAGNWGVEPDPIGRRFDDLLNVVRRHAPSTLSRPIRVLDVGCFNGAMLKHFGDSFERFGVEPSREAAAMASSRGINMLGDTIEHIEGRDGFFDVIISVDVLEHINDPDPFFQRVSRLLQGGQHPGVFICMTGDADAPAFRLNGGLHWYVSALPEHVSFWNRSSLNAAGKRCGLGIIEHRRMSHDRLYRRDWLGQTARNLAFAAVRSIGGLHLPILKRRFARRGAPSWIASADHMICVLRRP
ncbi:MAG: methyltransferase domain-containing protein [Tepidisphaera sp.]|nr:methyltransferase domain-containing protein [Tepidisphaera sp.]